MQIDDPIEGASPESGPDEFAKPADTPVDAGTGEVKKKIVETLDAAGRKKKKLGELAAKREAGEISPHDLDHNFLWQLSEGGFPLTRKDMLHESGYKPVVVTKADLETIGIIDFIGAKGDRIIVESDDLDPDDVYIIYPEEVGEEIPEGEAKETPEKPEILSHEIRMQRVLFEIFGDVAVEPPAVRNADWEKILAVNERTVFACVTKGRSGGIPEAYVRSFAYEALNDIVSQGKYEMALNILRNLRLATDEQIEEIEVIAAEVNPAIAQARESRAFLKEAEERIRDFFADVPEREALEAELPEFWGKLTRKQWEKPAGVLIDGRASGVPEKHLMRFAYEVVKIELKKPDFHWISKFLRSFKLGSEETVVFFETLAAKKK